MKSYSRFCIYDLMLPLRTFRFRSLQPSISCHLPLNACYEEDEVPVDFGAVDKFINIAGVHCLRRLQATRPYAVTHWQSKSKITHKVLPQTCVTYDSVYPVPLWSRNLIFKELILGLSPSFIILFYENTPLVLGHRQGRGSSPRIESLWWKHRPIPPFNDFITSALITLAG